MDGERAETCLRLMMEAELRRVARLPPEPDPGWHDPDSAWSCVDRLRYVAATLTAVGAIDAELAEAVTDDLDAALTVRARLLLGRLAALPSRQARRRLAGGQVATRPGSGGPGWPGWRGWPGWLVHVLPVGRRLLVTGGDGTSEVCVISLVRAEDREMFAVTARFAPEPARSPPGRPRRQPVRHPLMAIEAEDELGGSYHVGLSGGFGERTAGGWLSVYPALPTGIQWLELHSGPGTPRLRVDVTAPPTPAEFYGDPPAPGDPPVPGRLLAADELFGTDEPPGAGGPLNAGGALGAGGPLGPGGPPAPPMVTISGERVVDGMAAALLAQLPDRRWRQKSVDEAVAALEDVGVLPPGSPAVSRLAELCWEAGFESGRGLAAAVAEGSIPPTVLPGPWTSVLEQFGRRRTPAGQRGVAPAAVTLPELDGARFVLAGLCSEPDMTTLTGLAFGVHAAHEQGQQCNCSAAWFPWWIRDSAGHWHVTELTDFRAEGTATTFTVSLVPPLPPPVTRLDVIINGPSRRLRVRVPVEWMVTDD